MRSLQPRLVLGVEGGAPPDGGEDARQRLLVVDQKIAGGGAHEHLDAGGAGQTLELGKLVDIVARGADEEGEVAMHAPRRARDLVGERLGARRRRACVFGISNTAVTPPSTADRLPVSRSSLCSSPGSRKCTWVSITPGRICRPVASMVSPASPSPIEPISAMRPSPHADIGEPLAGLIDDGRRL